MPIPRSITGLNAIYISYRITEFWDPFLVESHTQLLCAFQIRAWNSRIVKFVSRRITKLWYTCHVESQNCGVYFACRIWELIVIWISCRITEGWYEFHVKSQNWWCTYHLESQNCDAHCGSRVMQLRNSFQNMYIYIYICMYTYILTYIHVHICIYKYVLIS